jgi:O-antigen/teichoic acid export membrane protein
MARDFALLLASLAMRVGTVLVLYIFLARAWGAEVFGQFMYATSVGALLVLACEFGFGVQILRDLGRAPSNAAALLGRLLGAKFWLTGVSIALTLVVVVATPSGREVALVLLLTTASSVLVSYSDFLFSALRALGQYRRETVVTLQGNSVALVFGLGALQWDGRPAVVAASLVLARLVQLALTRRSFVRVLPQKLPIDLRPRVVWPVVRTSAPFGAEVAVAAVYVNADTLLVTHVLGYAATGVYQAAARFYQGACQLPPVFASLFLPRLARQRDDPSAMARDANRLMTAMLVTGVLCFAAFLALPGFISWLLQDPSLTAAASLLPWFGVLVLARFSASAVGIVVTALDGQVARVWALGASLLVMGLLAMPMMASHGTLGMVLTGIASHVVLAVLFMAWVRRRGVNVGTVFLLSQALLLACGLVVWKLV